MTELRFTITAKYHVAKRGYTTKHKATTEATAASAARAIATLCDVLQYQVATDGGVITNMVVQCSIKH